jgi:hypothetical protein
MCALYGDKYDVEGVQLYEELVLHGHHCVRQRWITFVLEEIASSSTWSPQCTSTVLCLFSARQKRNLHISEDVNIPHTNYSRIVLPVEFYQVKDHFKMSINYRAAMPVPVSLLCFMLSGLLCVCGAPYVTLIGVMTQYPASLI